MMEIKLLGIRCNDIQTRKASSTQGRKLFGGYKSYEILEASMDKQGLKPFGERLRPCLEYNDWWVIQAQTCVKCEKAIWDLLVNGERQVAGHNSINGKSVEIACVKTGKIFKYTIGQGFE